MKENIKCYCGHTTTCDCGTEEPKQETLEEVARTKFPYKLFVNVDVTNKQREVFIEGYKLAQKRSYSKKEVILLLQKAITHQDDGETGSLVTAQGKIRTANFYSWFKQFKKK